MPKKTFLAALSLSLIGAPVLAQGIFEAGSLYGTGARGPGYSNAAGVGAARAGSLITNMGARGATKISGTNKSFVRTIDPDVADAAGQNATKLYQQAQLKEKQGKSAEAAKLYEQSLSIRDSIWGDRDPAVYEICKSLSAIYKKQGRDADRARCYRRMLTIATKKSGPGNLANYPLVQSLADVTFKLKRYPESAVLFGDLLALQQKKGLAEKDTVGTRINMAVSYVETSKYKEAEKALSEALAIEEQSSAPNKTRMLSILDNYSKVFRSTDRADDAEKVEAKARELRGQSAPSAPAPETAPASNSMPAPASGTAPPATPEPAPAQTPPQS